GNISQPEMLPQGFYELDKTFGEVLHSYPNESENAIYYTNGKELDFTNKYIKIIKDYNRVRVFLSNSRHNFRYTDPDVSIKDIENININGSIGIISLFSGMEVELVDFFEYDNVNEVKYISHDKTIRSL